MSISFGNKRVNYGLDSSIEILQTSEQGDRLATVTNLKFVAGEASGNVIDVDPAKLKQSIVGIGTSFTESSAFVLAHLSVDKRTEVMEQIFSEKGANFSLARTPVGSCDFCVEGRYTYADHIAGDTSLQCFSIEPDLDGFDSNKYPGIKDPSFDLLPMITQACQIKSKQDDKTFRIIASPWTAPVWMKDIEDWYQPGSAANNYQGTGGSLKACYQATFAEYLVKYLDAYRAQDIDIWAITPVNEPLGNSGQWESMHFTAQSQNDFIKHYLGPKLQQSDNANVRLLIYDHSRDKLEHWADTIYTDADTARYVYGAAVHWYESTFKVYEDVFNRVHEKYPDYAIIHSEGCIDDLGNDAPPGVLDPAGFKESGWFDNDDFWWNDNASDWGYTVPWPGVNVDDHPLYAPVHRYARNIIVSLNNWVCGWIDWNIVLDRRGGPNHVGNYCGAPIMIDVSNGYVYYTPIFYVLAQFSRTIRPGDRVVFTELFLLEEAQNDIYACATINAEKQITVQVLNTSKQTMEYALQIGHQHAAVTIDANSLQSIRIQLPADLSEIS
ncbi:MAG: glycosyl hydrolase [Gammaproteobacteria bacterium]|nr:glycosyl hydrolase [Gammaproteobacteria bacterium]